MRNVLTTVVIGLTLFFGVFMWGKGRITNAHQRELLATNAYIGLRQDEATDAHLIALEPQIDARLKRIGVHPGVPRLIDEHRIVTACASAARVAVDNYTITPSSTSIGIRVHGAQNATLTFLYCLDKAPLPIKPTQYTFTPGAKNTTLEIQGLIPA